MSDLIREMCKSGPVVTDGAWGTQLQARGLVAGACPELWNLTRADCVADVARAYVEAGSEVILTNTFGANAVVLARHGLADQVSQINRAGVAISKSAAGRRARVFASMGPTGKILEMDEISVAEVSGFFTEQADALAGAGADAIVVETMSALAEARLAVKAARETGLPVVASMTFGAGRDGTRTVMGVTPEQAAATLMAAGASAIGANCGEGAARLLPVCQRLRAVTDLPLWLKPNAGRPELIDGKSVYAHSGEDVFAEQVEQLIAAGANFVGGCCGTGPSFIRALAERLTGKSRE